MDDGDNDARGQTGTNGGNGDNQRGRLMDNGVNGRKDNQS